MSINDMIEESRKENIKKGKRTLAIYITKSVVVGVVGYVAISCALKNLED